MNRIMANLRPDLAVIAGHVASGAKVLDVGCGDGTLMAALRDERGCDARGLELDPANVAACVAQGLSAIQGDADTDLSLYPDASFDYDPEPDVADHQAPRHGAGGIAAYRAAGLCVLSQFRPLAGAYRPALAGADAGDAIVAGGMV
jgi:SAM-dependent methyltransferase